MKRIELFTAALTAALLTSSALAPLSRAGFQEGVEAYEAKDYMTAFEEWLPLAQKNDPAAMRNVGHMYRRGLGVPQDFAKAMTWYKRAATIGFDRAQANVAGMYLAGEGVKQDYAQAANWFARAAQQGHVISQYNLALLLENGLGVKKDERMALGWFELAAKAGHPGAAKRAAELTAEFKTRDPITADMSSEPVAVTATAEDAETDVSTQSAAEEAKGGAETKTAAEPAVSAETEIAETPETATPAPPETAAEATAASSEKGVQKKSFYEALRSLVTKDTAEENAPQPAAPAEPSPTVATATPADKTTSDAIEPATSGAVTRAEEPPTPAMKPAPEPADKPAVAEAPKETMTVASNPAPAVAEPAQAPATSAPAAPGSGLSLAEKMEMADLAYSLQQYQQSLGIWAPLAAEGNAMAQYRMGVLFNNGQGVPVDRVRAYYWWDKARSNGSAAAASAIGTLEQTLTHLEKRQIDRVN
ncbi:MAG: hypothetical protein CMN56_11540 [Sneathiella sp.]|uniref:hypothetical protein n=1 Tax=Sneathiella sp. TaxID=1964365 RepID=UPI000C57969A|nr:hypothetical protein [Sneathiella sp.]MAZ03759.1 hypothetical protein [Sneathiella sp.]